MNIFMHGYGVDDTTCIYACSSSFQLWKSWAYDNWDLLKHFRKHMFPDHAMPTTNRPRQTNPRLHPQFDNQAS